MNHSVKDILAAIGVVCEIAGVMCSELIKNGFTRQEALSLVGEYIISNFNSRPNKEDN